MIVGVFLFGFVLLYCCGCVLVARFFSAEELGGARVFDSEGLFYGLFDGYVVRGGVLFLRVVVEVSARQPVVDVDRLVEALRGRGVRVRPGEPLEVLVARARELGVDVPYRSAESRVRLLKALVPVSEVAVVDSRRLVRGSEEVVERVVVLRTPREARYRGRKPVLERPGVPPLEEVRGRLVVSLSEGILGYVEDLVIGPGEPGLRVSRSEGVSGYINWLGFLNSLKKRGLLRVYERLAEYRDPLVSPRLDLSLLPRVRELLEELGVVDKVSDLLEEFVVREPLRGSFVDVPWSRVLKVADIVLTK